MYSFFRMIGDLATLLSRKEIAQAGLVLALAAFMSLFEAIGVASILPFLAVVGNPALVRESAPLNWLYSRGGFSDVNSFMFALGLLAFALTVFASLFRAVAQFAIFHFASMRMHAIGMRLMQAYLKQPYAYFLRRNTSDISKRILSDVQLAVENSLLPALQMIANTVTVLVLAITVVIVSPFTAMLVILIVCGVYGLVFYLSRKKMDAFGATRNRANAARFTIASEAFGGIREIKQLGRELGYIRRFEVPSREFGRTKTISDNYAYLPKYAVEAVAFGGAISIILFQLKTGGDLGSILPILGIYAFAGYRILPAVQIVHAGLTRVRFGRPVVEALAEDQKTLAAHETKSKQLDATVELRNSIRFEEVAFHYDGTDTRSVADLSIEIRAKTTVGIVGATSSGKTTAVDLLAGLLVPTSGRILIDGRELTDSNRAAWMHKIGYVPQQGFLTDATVAENIGFGIPATEIDHSAVVRAARIANIHHFVSQLPHGYQTIVGERGVRLSGGQRQRISIARALYEDPSLLILDEATSALDSATETEVLEAIANVRGDCTVVMIAHRLNTVRACDQIIVMDKGRAILSGRYQDLLAKSAKFRALAGELPLGNAGSLAEISSQ